MKKVVLVFVLSLVAILGFSQCNFKVLIPLNKQYKVTAGDTVNNYARVEVSENSNIRIEFDTVFQNTQIPVKITTNADTPLIITHAYWGEPYISPNFTREPIFKGDTALGYYMLHCNNYQRGQFNKRALVKTNRCKFSFTFRGVRACNRRDPPVLGR